LRSIDCGGPIGHASKQAANLVSPLVDDGHVDVIDEDEHLLAGGRAVRGAHALVHVALHRSLEGGRETRQQVVAGMRRTPSSCIQIHLVLHAKGQESQTQTESKQIKTEEDVRGNLVCPDTILCRLFVFF